MNVLKKENAIPFVLIFFLVLFILNGSYLPMVDLPQHASQVSILDQLIKGKSPWSSIVDVNFNTPYLIGYLSWLGIYQFFDIVTASRILVSIIFLLYIFSILKLMKALNATVLVLWVAIPSFFGFSFQWGFVTFLFSISIGILFFVQNIKSLEGIKKSNMLFIGFLGSILYLSHILSFAFFCFLSFLYIILKLYDFKRILKYLPVYTFFLILLIFYFFKKDPLTGLYSYGSDIIWHGFEEKILNLLVYPWGMVRTFYHVLISALLLLFPFVMGFSFSKETYRYIPVFGFLLLWFLLPHFINNTYFIYERFSLLFFCFYYLIFDENKLSHNFNKVRPVTFTFFFAIIFYLISQIIISIHLMKKDSQDFVQVLEYVPTQKRVLTLAFANTSPSVGIPFAYVHFGSWYQAEKQGWSDFNFAWFHPQIVRFKPNKVPQIQPGFEWTPLAVQNLKSCAEYDLLFVRAYSSLVDEIIKNSPCKDYSLFVNRGTWFIYAKKTF